MITPVTSKLSFGILNKSYFPTPKNGAITTQHCDCFISSLNFKGLEVAPSELMTSIGRFFKGKVAEIETTATNASNKVEKSMMPEIAPSNSKTAEIAETAEMAEEVTAYNDIYYKGEILPQFKY